MTRVRWFRVFGLIAISLILGLSVSAESGDPAVLQQKLNAQFKLTTTTADRTDIVTAGDVVEIRKPGLVMFSVDTPISPTSTYKNGSVGQGFGTQMLMADKTTDRRRFVPGEKCWVTRILVQNDSVTIDLYSDPYNDVRYYGTLKFVYPEKKTVPPVDAFLQTIAEVVRVVPQDNQGGSGQSPAPGNGADSATSVAGKYVRTGNNNDYIQVGSAGSFVMFQGGKAYAGTYKADGDSLVLSGPNVPAQKCHLVGDTLTDPGGTAWRKQAEVGAASAAVGTPGTSPMQDIAPPPPPPDAAPPTIALGQTKAQVTAGFGQPTRVAKLGVKEIYYYKDMKVTFTNGKVSNVD